LAAHPLSAAAMPRTGVPPAHGPSLPQSHLRAGATGNAVAKRPSGNAPLAGPDTRIESSASQSTARPERSVIVATFRLAETRLAPGRGSGWYSQPLQPHREPALPRGKTHPEPIPSAGSPFKEIRRVSPCPRLI